MASSSIAKSKTKKLDRFLSREEEFKRLNAELEEKTANLINQAETVLRGQDELFQEETVDVTRTEDHTSQITSSSAVTTQRNEISQTRRPHSAKEIKTTSNAVKTTKTIRPKSSHNPVVRRTIPSKKHVPTDILQQRIELANTISTFEEEAMDEVYTPSKQEDSLPDAAEEMGAEATIRFLKAKLRVMQEELDRMSVSINDRDAEVEESHGKIKELSDELGRQQKVNASVQAQMDKYKKLYEEIKEQKKATNEESTTLRKELEGFKRQQKQANVEKNAVEVRLNRALEEIQKNKQLLSKARESSKDSTNMEKKRFDQLIADNKKLEKQKGELMTAFKKQLKLIDILKRQKMHLEAAKMLQFSEEEFVKALEWGS